ncbi:MAG TPA: hypothetical protein VKZ81_28030 [Pseudonocardia sp.]|uniref:hypothetical protein n=1 Tax=Pseudonocardia sp. TaxID=60912 RepID=UPI002B4B7EE1|nr:hypothetical protein [Pseudonocardia sp.]HLU59329.1 hypothetical protein [Pseudonocardia sp.]
MPVIPDLESILPEQRRGPRPVPADPPQPPAQRTVANPCTCGHGPEAHEHYRPGSDCGACGRNACREYRPANSGWRRLLRGLGLRG